MTSFPLEIGATDKQLLKQIPLLEIALLSYAMNEEILAS
jgi:hypothetical protein